VPADAPVDRRAAALAAARGLLDAEGAEALTMRRLADELGIRAPSLYKHFADKAELEAALMAKGLEEFDTALASAADGDIAALARAYRRFGLAHPHLYRLLTERPLPRDRLPAGLEERAGARIVAAAGDPDRARALWAFAHGMVALELAGRFPPDADLDAAWDAGVQAFSGA
jgi:AcrR family transcriptional regulator